MRSALIYGASALAIVGSGLATAGGRFDPTRAAAVAAGFVSYQMCGAAFIGGIDPAQYYSEAIEPILGPASALLSYKVDRASRQVSARFAGVLEAVSVDRSAGGCLVQHGAPLAAIARETDRPPAALAPIAGPAPVAAKSPALEAAIERAFKEIEGAPRRRTKAVVVIHDNRIVAERYADGYDAETPMHGWSMTKSITNALLGVLVRQGKLTMDAPTPVTAWRDALDPRHAITPDQLLRMESGLDIGQSLIADWTDAFNPASQMLFDEPDMGAFAANAPLGVPPGRVWNYTNGNTQVLSAIIRDAAGGDAASTLRFADHELFAPLGMNRVTLELDATGAPIGSSMMWATPRDWARFGLLFLNDGIVGGRRLLPEGWADYSARATSTANRFGYGAGFWTNRDDGPGARRRIGGGMPADSYFARGTQGQYVVIAPSKRLVVVRMGYSEDAYGDIDMVSQLVGDVIVALEKRAAER